MSLISNISYLYLQDPFFDPESICVSKRLLL